MSRYIPCTERDIPSGVRFDVPGRLQGQHVEVAYGGHGAATHDDGDLYKRVTDHGVGGGAPRYYKLAEVRS